MDEVFQVAALLVWVPLNLLIIAALLRGEYRRYPLILACAVVEFLAAAGEIPAYWAVYNHVRQSRDLQNIVYWLDEAVSQVLIYAVVIGLIYRASQKLESRRLVRICLTGGAVSFAAISFAIHYSPGVTVGIWMTPWTRDLNFCAAVLDLILWGLLIASREKDQRLLLLSGALGIQFTGEAIGESVRDLATGRQLHTISQLGGELMVVADIVRTYIWWRVFRTAEAPAGGARKVATNTLPNQAAQKQ
jgi:hypothetical protein